MIGSDEGRHLESGATDGDVPGGLGLSEFEIVTTGSADEVIARAKQVLNAVLRMGAEHFGEPRTAADLLPAWFVEGCAQEPSPAELERWLAWWRGLDAGAKAAAEASRGWTLAEWLSWMQPDERQWYWWDVYPDSEHSVRVAVEVRDWPTPVGDLAWLLKVAGAAEFRPAGGA